jgi:hypothetical protein
MPDPQDRNTNRKYESDTLHVQNVRISSEASSGKNSGGSQSSVSGQPTSGKITGELVLRIIERLKGI